MKAQKKEKEKPAAKSIIIFDVKANFIKIFVNLN